MLKAVVAPTMAVLMASTLSAKADEIAIALHVEPDNPVFEIARRMAEQIETASGDKFDVVLLGLEVGGERDQIEATTSGEYQIVLGGSVPMAIYAPEYAAADLPFVWDSIDQARDVYSGDREAAIQDALAQNGNLHLVGLSMRNPRNLTSNRPITAPDELSDAKIRVPQIEAWVDVWSEIGALPSPIAWPEVYTSLQTGVIEMQENPVENIQSGKLFEVQTHVNQTEHVHSFFHWLANDEWWNSLSEEDRTLIQTAVDEATAWGDEQTKASAASIASQLEGEGMSFVEVDKTAFRTAAEPAIRRVAEGFAPSVRDYVLQQLD